MGISVSGRPYPFPEMELVKKCKNVSGTAMTRGQVVQLIVGKNGHSSTVDGVASGDFFPGDTIVLATTTSYPTTGHSGIVAGDAIPILGYVDEAIADDEYGRVIFRGFVSQDTATATTAALISSGDIVYLDADASYALKTSAGITPAAGDIGVARVAGATTPGGTSGPIDMFWDGVNPLVHTAV